MHTEKQVRDTPSRMFRQPEGKGTQQFRLRDNRGSAAVQESIVCQLASINIECGGYKATGQSGHSYETMNNMESIKGFGNNKNFLNLFSEKVKSKKIKPTDKKERTPYTCAEPNALSNLLRGMYDSGHVIDDNDFAKITFPSQAIDKGKSIPPCAVCQQWVMDGTNNISIADVFDSFTSKPNT